MIQISPENLSRYQRANDYMKVHFGKMRFYKVIVGAGNFYAFTAKVVNATRLLHKENFDTFFRVTLNQVKFTGTKAFPLLSIIALTIGASTIIQAFNFLPKFGANDFMGNLLKLVIVREVGPLITAIVILTRSGSAIATELATQKLHGEIESIELMGINPFSLLILPRVIAGLLATTLLIVYFDLIAFMGGFGISTLVSSYPFSSFLESILQSASISDLFSTAVKSAVYGLTIPLVCSYYGYQPTTLFEIPIFVSRAVVRSLFAVFLLNILISVIFYL